MKLSLNLDLLCKLSITSAVVMMAYFVSFLMNHTLFLLDDDEASKQKH